MAQIALADLRLEIVEDIVEQRVGDLFVHGTKPGGVLTEDSAKSGWPMSLPGAPGRYKPSPPMDRTYLSATLILPLSPRWKPCRNGTTAIFTSP
jgi:hypothetical protein